jgi:N-acyl amino acid synthase of PEP-CTERM/exosortase system
MMTNNDSTPVTGGGVSYFEAGTIDDDPKLLEESYRLRYQVYCLERKFLPPEHYPQGLESDEFDRHSIHVGAINARGELAGTARVVRVSDIGLPLFRHCTTFPHETELHPANPHVVEVGRLIVNRIYRRRLHDDPYGVNHAPPAGGTVNRVEERRRGREDVLQTLMKAVYQATKRIGATHWLAAMEAPLERLLIQYGLPFRLIGPESDYLGIVAPYRMDLKEFDQVIVSGRIPALEHVLVGLEPEFGPLIGV